MSYRFESISYLYWLGVLLIIIPLMIYALQFTTHRLRKLFKPEVLEILTRKISFRKRKVKALLEVLVIVLLIIALARPQSGESTEKVRMEGIEVIFALDLSNSMLAEDLKPSRLDLAKRTIERLLDRLSGFKVGLVGFAGNAALMSPLTTDYSALKLFLDSATPDALSSQGTNIAAAIQVADKAFERGGTENDEITKVTKVIIFFSDGEDHEPGALKEIESLLNKGIRVFSIGVGTAQGAPVPIRDEFGNLRSYKKDDKGQTVLSKVNTSFLQELARKGKGSYYHASFDGSEVTGIENDLNKLEKTEFESDFLKKYNENFEIFLFLGFILLMIELFVTDRKKTSEGLK